MTAPAHVPAPSAPPAPPRSVAATWSLILGILSIACLWIFGSITSIILGCVALWRIDATQPVLRGKSIAVAGIVIGSAGAAASVFMGGLISAIFVPTHPAVSNALQRPEWVHAEGTAYQVKNSISAYFTEYRRYPVRQAGGDLTLETGFGLMGVLLASNRETDGEGLNPRQIVFYTDRAAKALDCGGCGRGIILDAEGEGILLDPWGRPYRVRLDTDYDNRVENPDPGAPGRILTESILVWSAGPDGDFDTWEDNVKTW